MFVIGEVSKRGITDIICGRCKQSCKIHAFNEIDGTPGHNISYATLEGRFPYGSTKDTEHHQLHLCEKCYDWLVALLKENGVEVDVAEGDIWTGLSRLDVPRF